MRDRLIELLSGKSLDTLADVEYVADFLLENGVTVPICDVGRKVYAIYDVSKYDFNGKQKKCDCMVTSLGSRHRPPRSTYGYLRGDRTWKVREIDYKKSYKNLIGKTVFLTRAEAEQAIRTPQNDEVRE